MHKYWSSVICPTCFIRGGTQNTNSKEHCMCIKEKQNISSQSFFRNLSHFYTPFWYLWLWPKKLWAAQVNSCDCLDQSRWKRTKLTKNTCQNYSKLKQFSGIRHSVTAKLSKRQKGGLFSGYTTARWSHGPKRILARFDSETHLYYLPRQHFSSLIQ